MLKRQSGVVMCILCCIPLLVAAFIDANDCIIISMVCVLFILVAIAVNLLVRVGRINESYEKLLQENKFSAKQKTANKKIAPISGAYWSVAVAIYLAWSFITNDWEFTWIVWPIAGILDGVVHVILNMLFKVEE